MEKISKFLILSILLFPILAFSQQKIEIYGKLITPTTFTQITLSNYLNPGAFTINAPIINADSFYISIEQNTPEEIYKLYFNNRNNFLALVLRPGEKVHLLINPQQLGYMPNIEGSPNSKTIYEVERILANIQKQIDSVQRLYNSAVDQVTKDRVGREYMTLNNAKNVYLNNVIRSNPGSLVNLFFIERLNIDNGFADTYKLVDSALMKNYPNHPGVLNFHNKTQALLKTSIGSKAPNIKLPTPNGDSLDLYSVKGELILVDFWASWCGPAEKKILMLLMHIRLIIQKDLKFLQFLLIKTNNHGLMP